MPLLDISCVEFYSFPCHIHFYTYFLRLYISLLMIISKSIFIVELYKKHIDVSSL